jgi:hypothetical protein
VTRTDLIPQSGIGKVKLASCKASAKISELKLLNQQVLYQPKPKVVVEISKG